MKPQLLTDCQDPDVLFRDGAFAAEEKLDGDRRLIVKRGDAVTGYTRTGNSTPLSETMLALALLTDGDWLLDGEAMPGGAFIAFDVLDLNGERITTGNGSRRLLLETVSPFAIVRRAVGERAKRDLAASVRAGRGEGVVFKRIAGEYRSGQRCDDWQRFKFYETDDFTVASVDIARCSVFVSLNGEPCGKVQSSFERLPCVGDKVRVRYEKRTANGKLLRARISQK